MRRESVLRERLRALDALRDAVGAMKSLSAAHFREARGAVGPARRYREGAERILACARAASPGGEGPAGLLVVGGELGLCGSYNSRVVELGAKERSELGVGPTYCVGRRAEALLARRGLRVKKAYSSPAGIKGVTALLLDLAEEILSLYVQEQLSCFVIVSSRFEGVGNSFPRSTRLLPIDPGPAPDEVPPRYVRREYLASMATREFLYITLYDLLIDALACEHGARLVATQAAEKWLDDRTSQLRRGLAAAHRETTTQEMIEIVSGVRFPGSNRPRTARRVLPGRHGPR